MTLDRLGDWLKFSKQVEKHIPEYAEVQYKNDDEGKDQICFYSAEECKKQIEKYIGRFGKQTRGNKEALRDCIKIAHYAQRMYDKLKEELQEPDVY